MIVAIVAQLYLDVSPGGPAVSPAVKEAPSLANVEAHVTGLSAASHLSKVDQGCLRPNL